MSEGTIIRLNAKKRPGSRSGRHSTREIYRKTGTGPRHDGTTRLERLPEIEKNRPGMATDYSCRLAPRNIARIQLNRRSPDHYRIDWVFVPPAFRAGGLGRRLMERVTADADAWGVLLSLEVRACAGLSQEELVRWYRSFGFFPTGRRGTFGPVFVRPPARREARRAA